MSRQLLFGALILAFLPLGAQAECTPEQKARMIKEDVPEETVERVCGDTKAAGEVGDDSKGASGVKSVGTDKVTEAEEGDEFRRFVIGWHSMVSGYHSTVSYSDGIYYYDAEMDYTGDGSGFYARINLNDNFALQGSQYSGTLTNDYSSASTSFSGQTAHLLWGGNFGYEGGNAYLGIGTFREKWDVSVSQDSFSGMSYLIGLSYKWEYLTLATEFASRSTGDYASYFEELYRDSGASSVSSSNNSAFTFHFKAGIPF
jgi:hypothetical protein